MLKVKYYFKKWKVIKVWEWFSIILVIFIEDKKDTLKQFNVIENQFNYVKRIWKYSLLII